MGQGMRQVSKLPTMLVLRPLTKALVLCKLRCYALQASAEAHRPMVPASSSMLALRGIPSGLKHLPK